jgi:hypothetical protein
MTANAMIQLSGCLHTLQTILSMVNALSVSNGITFKKK